MEQLPPQKIEPLFIRSLLTEPKYVNIISEHFEKHWLNDEDFGNLTSIVIKYYEKYNKLPSQKTLDLIILKSFPEKHKEISSKLNTIYSLNLNDFDKEYLDEQLLNYLRNAGLYWTIMSSIETIEKNKTVSECMERMRSISTMDFNYDIGLQYFDELDQHLERIANPEARLPTGWDSFDHIMNGGWYKSGRCLAIFIGETHIGKSLVLSNLAANYIKMGKFPVIITLEMCEDVYAQRIDAHISKVDINHIKTNLEKVKSDVEKIKSKFPESDLVIKEFPPDSISCNHIKTYIDKLIVTKKRKPDIIIIDYTNLLIPDGHIEKDSNSYTKIGKVSRQMRALSYHYEIPVVSASQVNRSGYNSTEVSLDKMSESMGIAHTADFVASLWQNEGDREAEIMNFTILKNRLGGRVGKNLQLQIDYSNLVISDSLSLKAKEGVGAVTEIIDEFQKA